jgi:PKD repeat protein
MANLQRVVAFLILAVVLSLSKTALGDTYYVPDHFASIQEAIDSPGMVAGDTIIVRDGVYYENISFTEQPLTVRSENGAATTIIDGGGSDAVAYFESDAVLEGFTITNGGRGIDCYHASPTIVNCVITGNTTAGYGAGIGYYGYCYPTVINCTISANHADDGGAAIYAPCIGLITIKNSILWGNTPNEIYMGGMGNTTVSITYSDVTGGWSGTGNINADPLFVDPVAGDFHIQADSPCVDAGTNSPPELPDIDFEGDPRVFDGDGDGTSVVDMGADEFFNPSLIHANFSADPTEGIAPLTVQFSDESTGEIEGWSWSFGDVETSTEQNPLHEYAEAGDYTVTLTVTGPGGEDTDTKTDYIQLLPAPVAAFTANVTSGTAPMTVQFTDQSTGPITNWSWDFGDGGLSSFQNTSWTYYYAGDYTVSLTVTVPGGSDTETKIGYIHVAVPEPPVAAFTANVTSGTAPLTVQFTNQSTGFIYYSLWDFGDGGGQLSPHTYTSAGDFTVSLTVTGPGGSDTEIKTNYIHVTEPSGAPIIDKIGGTKEPGKKIRIIGSYFGHTQGDSVVHLGSRTYDSSKLRIKLWSDTMIKIKLPNYACSWFKRDVRRLKVWVTVGGVDSNVKNIRVQKPATCP